MKNYEFTINEEKYFVEFKNSDNSLINIIYYLILFINIYYKIIHR